MAIYAASRERSIEEIRETLGNLVQDFEADAPGNRKLIRDLLDNDRELFYSGAIEILKNSADSRGAQYLVALLVANALLLEAICDPALTREQAFALGRAAVRVDPAADAGLARGLADSESGQGTVIVRDAPRLMEVLCEIGDPGRMMSSMLRLLRHPNPYIRSKAVKVVGRGSRSPKWVRQRLADPDPRIRANAVESLWCVDSTEARALLQFALSDGNNRVVANALLGLYYLGSCHVLAELARLAGDESATQRASAAWAMGETGDIRFQDYLRRMLNDADPVVRKRAFAAIGRLKASSAPVDQSSVWHVAVREAGADSKAGRRVLVAVAGDDLRDQPEVPPLGFHLSECGSYVLSYTVTERPAPEAMSLVFLIPRQAEAGQPFRQAIETCLRWKRPNDYWCVLPYLESGDGTMPEGDQNASGLPFTLAVETLRKTLNEPASRVECMDLWSTLWRATQLEGAKRGPRHIFILSSGEEARLAGHGVISRSQNSRLQLQAISAGANGHLRDFCAAVGAPFHAVEPAEIQNALRHSYLSLLARYEVAYQANRADAKGLKLRVQAPGGSGETAIQYGAG